MTENPRMPKFSEDELAFGRCTTRHLGISLKALAVPWALSAIILANGDYLSKLIDVEPNSILFQLWPYNEVYLRQFASSPYVSSEIKWFFTVVSCSNAIWLAFLCWKVFFELFRRDVQFPRTKSAAIIKSIFVGFFSGWLLLLLFGLVTMAGFATRAYGLAVVAFNQSIAASASTIVMAEMAGLYIGAGFVLEFGGLGLRYFLSRTFGCFVVEAPDPQGVNMIDNVEAEAKPAHGAKP